MTTDENIHQDGDQTTDSITEQGVDLTTGRLNYRLNVASGVATQLAMNLTHPSLVLSVFVRSLGGSNALVGSLSAIRFGGWFLPQFFAAGWVQPLRRKTPLAIALELVRIVIYGLLGILTYVMGLSNPALLLIVFFVLFTISRLVAGIGALARTDVIAKTIAPNRRAAFFALRNLLGQMVVFGAGFFVSYVLDDSPVWQFPANFTLLFGVSTAVLVLALVLLSRVREPEGPAGLPHHSLKQQLARAPALLRGDASLRRYLLVRVLLNMTRLSAPFYPILALDVLSAPASMVGFYMSAMTLSGFVSNPFWQRMAQRKGNTYVVKAAALLTAAEPLAAIALPWLMRWGGYTVQKYGLLPAYVFAVVFLIAGAAESGRGIGLMTLMLDIAPEHERASYVGLVNTALGFVSLLPILAGAIIDRIGFEPIFFCAAVLLLGGYLATLGWKQPEEP